MQLGSDLELWTLIVGFLLPTVLALLQQPGWSDRLRALVAFGASAVAGAGTVYFTDPDAFTTQPVIRTILVVFVVAIATYRNWWKPTGIAPEIEVRSSNLIHR